MLEVTEQREAAQADSELVPPCWLAGAAGLTSAGRWGGRCLRALVWVWGRTHTTCPRPLFTRVAERVSRVRK